MSIITSSKHVSQDTSDAVQEFLKKTNITVVPAKQRKHTKSKAEIAAREKAVEAALNAREKAFEAEIARKKASRVAEAV